MSRDDKAVSAISDLTPFHYSLSPQHHQNKKQNQHLLPTTSNTKSHNHQIEISQIWLPDNLRQNMKLSLKHIVFDGKLCHTSERNRLWAQPLTLLDVTGNDWFIYLRWCSFFFNLRDLPTFEYLVKFWGRQGKVKVKNRVFFIYKTRYHVL